MLQIIDMQWKDHLLNIDHLKEGIGLRGYAQKDPLIDCQEGELPAVRRHAEPGRRGGHSVLVSVPTRGRRVTWRV